MSRNVMLAVLGAIAFLLIAAIGTELLASRDDDETAARTKPPATGAATAKAKAPVKATAKGQPAEAESDEAADADKDEDGDQEEKEDAEDKADPGDSASAGILASDVLARPLFAPSRRPPSLPAATADARDSTLPRLTGIVVLTGLKLAIFQGTDKPLVVREGGRVAGRRVETIGPLEVVLQGPQGEEKLHTMPDSTLVREHPPQPAQAAAKGTLPQAPNGGHPRNREEAAGRPGAGHASPPGQHAPPPASNANRPAQPGRAFFPPGPNRNRP